MSKIKKEKDGAPAIPYSHEALKNGERDSSETNVALGETSILVGIPAFNEETSIGSTVLAARQYASDIIVIDDGSDDQTGAVARLAGAKVLTHDENKGKGAAVQTLFRCVETSNLDVLVLLDGDGQHLPADIPGVIEPIIDGTADIVIGSRYSDSESDDETPLYRRFGQKVLDTLTVGSSGIKVSDSQSGFRALSTEAIESLSLTSNGYGVESEMLTAAADSGLDIAERPVDVRYEEVDGQNQTPIRHGMAVVNSILHIVRDRRPLLFFGVPGLLLATFGCLYGIQGILVYQATGVFYPAKAMVSGFLVIVGVLSSFCGLLLDQMTNVIAQVVSNSNP